jgi:hypothetical protein
VDEERRGQVELKHGGNSAEKVLPSELFIRFRDSAECELAIPSATCSRFPSIVLFFVCFFRRHLKVFFVAVYFPGFFFPCECDKKQL